MITSVEVSGYRLLDEFTADFGDLTVVIGANGAGKSTLMDFLQLTSQCVELPVNAALSWHMGMTSVLSARQGSNSISWKLNFKKPRYETFWGKVGLDQNKTYTYEVVLNSDATGQVYPQYEVLRNYEAYHGHEGPFKYLEATRFRSVVFDHSQHKLIPFDSPVLPTESAKGNEEEEVGENQTASPPARDWALLLSRMRFPNQFPAPSLCRFLLASMCFYPGFNVGKSSPLRVNPSEIRPFTTLQPDGENLGTVLHEILTRYDFREQADSLRDFMSAAYPFFEEVTAETAFGAPPRVLVRIREKGMSRSMELWDISDGMLRFLCLAAALLNPFPPPFIAIDEPEVGLHPRLLPILADMIKTSSERTQVLVTTHSPDLLNRFAIEDVAVMSREGIQARWFRPSSRETLLEMLKNVAGETLGDLHRSGELEAYN